MNYTYGKFSDRQAQDYEKHMHNEVHILLLFKDPKVDQTLFKTDEEFHNYFVNLLYKFGGLNELLGCPNYFVELMTVLRLALAESEKAEFDFATYRKLILDAHGLITAIFKQGVQ